MIEYEDLVKLDDKTMQNKIKNFQKLDLSDYADKWLAVSYIYAINKGLADYQARSFASELTLFITNKIYNTDVEFVYREDWIDSHLYDKFEEIKSKHDNIKSKEFWNDFIDYMLHFYGSSMSWKYERVSKYLQFRITEYEKKMFALIPKSKPKEKFIFIMEYFPPELEDFEFERRHGDLDKTFSINLTRGEYDRFMQLEGDTKTQKFLNMLYFWAENEVSTLKLRYL